MFIRIVMILSIIPLSVSSSAVKDSVALSIAAPSLPLVASFHFRHLQLKDAVTDSSDLAQALQAMDVDDERIPRPNTPLPNTDASRKRCSENSDYEDDGVSIVQDPHYPSAPRPRLTANHHSRKSSTTGFTRPK